MKYFATLPPNEIGTELAQKVKAYYRYIENSGVGELFTASYRAYHGVSSNASNATSHFVSRGGKHGQLSMVKVNHYRNIAQHIKQLTTAQRPAPQPIATNSDAKSQKQVTIARGVLEYYGRDKRVDRILALAAEHAVVFSEGFVSAEWDTSGGKRVGNMPSGSPMMEGDIVFNNILPIDCIRDPSLLSAKDMRWVIVRRPANKWDLAAKYAPESADGADDSLSSVRDSILNSPSVEGDKYRAIMLGRGIHDAGKKDDTDEIFVYDFFHDKTPAVPDGLKVTFVDDGTVLFHGPLPYRSIPVRRISASETIGTPFGYSAMFDLLGIQEIIDALYSAVATNQLTFGVQLIAVLKGSDVDFKKLARGLSVLEYSNPNAKPEPINLTHTPAEIFNFIQQLEQTMETISGVNSVVRGNPETSLKSGSALALVQSQAIQFSSGLQQSYAQLVEDVFTDTLNILKDYAKSERVITIVGKYNRPMLEAFTGDSISDVNRVIVDAGSALSQTIAGRTQIAQDLLQSGLIKRPEEYIGVMNTGKLDPMLEADIAELILVRSENEELAAARPVHALVTDEHILHIREHRAVMASSEVRNNPNVMSVYAGHIQEHVGMLSDPALANLLSVLGQTPLSQANMPTEQAAGGTPPKQMTSVPAEVAPPPEPVLPKNPVTGEQWDAQTGGGMVPQEGGDAPPGSVREY